ncbi:MAG TPA: hypothetical protein PKD05_03955 [Candidatus Melainabacteria bacterium]|nr:hypothetical protein [Candidatus Melainabacteria bacterium]
MSKRESVKKRALMAILLAGGMLGSAPGGYAAPKAGAVSKSQLELVNKIVGNQNLSSELRAYYLIQIARSALQGVDRGALEKQYRPYAEANAYNLFSRRKDAFNNSLSAVASQLSLEAHSTKEDKPGDKRGNSALAETALKEAIPLLETSDNPFARLNLYFMASYLLRKTGNEIESKYCQKKVNDAIKGCESDFSKHANQLEGVVAVLDSMAYGYVPVQISDWQRPSAAGMGRQTKNYGEKNIAEAEKLKLRALALADRLDSGSQLRRKAHRDMVLWYQELGKSDAARNEKEILFNLVGVHDDKILYPQSSGCGNVIWWKAEIIKAKMACGMG